MPANALNYRPWVRRLHWTVFILVACALLLIYIHGWTERGAPAHAGAKWAHMQFGMAVLLVMLPRLLVRVRHGKAPPIAPAAPRWQTLLAHAVHYALYALLLATPLLGIANRMWNPGDWDFLGIPMPHVVTPDHAFAKTLEGVHKTLGNTVMYLAAAHALAALIHHFVRRDNTLRRMLPTSSSN
ncbi:MAG TPA: cytochrome b/b6 domain-containing protein [Rhodanobacteraceae bacterium]